MLVITHPDFHFADEPEMLHPFEICNSSFQFLKILLPAGILFPVGRGTGVTSLRLIHHWWLTWHLRGEQKGFYDL